MHHNKHPFIEKWDFNQLKIYKLLILYKDKEERK
jgi:hypothetical protein